VYGVKTGSGMGAAGAFEIQNASNTGSALYASTNGSGAAVFGWTSGDGNAGQFQTSGNNGALYAKTTGSGMAVHGDASGSGTAGYFNSTAGYGLIVASGNVGIGITNPGYALEVNGSIKSGGLEANFIQSAQLEASFIHVANNLTVDGTITTHGGCSGCSDMRWKKNISPITNALETVGALHGVNYQWRVDEYPDRFFKRGNDIGFIAQEVEKVLPELVYENGGYKFLNYDRLTAVLVEAVKELEARHATEIEQLKAENEALKQDMRKIKEALGL
jgi:hypothetical protein